MADGTPRGPQPDSIDRLIHAHIGRATAGISPAALALAYVDWAVHLASSPGKQAAAGREGRAQGAFASAIYAARPRPTRRLSAPASSRCRRTSASRRGVAAVAVQPDLPGVPAEQQWWHNATTGVRGVSPQHEQVVAFVDAAAARRRLAVQLRRRPIPRCCDATVEQGGQNLVRGALNFVEDWERAVGGKPPVGTEAFQVGRRRRRHAGQGRLPQPADRADPVRADDRRRCSAEPVLIVPAWIMKYYILDLSPHNSLVRTWSSRATRCS